MSDNMPSLIPSADEIVREHSQVIIIGAGPVGLLTALKIAKQGIQVTVIEAERHVLQSPRATTYMPIVLNEFEKVGIYEDIVAAGHMNEQGIVFREANAKGGAVLGSLLMSQVPKGVVKFGFAGIHMGQHTLAEIILKHCRRGESFNIVWGQRFCGVKQEKSNVKPVTVTTVGPAGENFWTCDYLIGADGAGSSVRRSQCIPFEGFTWQDFRFVATNVKYDFEKHGGFTTANMIVDEEDWAVIARTGPGDAPWRVAFGVRTTVPEADILSQVPSKFERLFPGPRPLRYELVSANPYWAHQRVAMTFRAGKIILCGDAGHSNNPIGGLGLTTGLLDAAALGNVLIRIITKGEDEDSLLDWYAQVRRDAWIQFANPQSVEFKLRCHSFHPDIVSRRNEFFDALNGDPSIHLKMASMMNEVMPDEFEVKEDMVNEHVPATEAQNVTFEQPLKT